MQAFGLGTTWYGGNKGEEQLLACVKHALDSGFRHIDEAEMYETEEQCGKAINEWMDANPSTPRSELFVTSKVLASINKIGVEEACKVCVRVGGAKAYYAKNTFGCVYLYVLHPQKGVPQKAGP